MNKAYGVSLPLSLDNKNSIAMIDSLKDLVRQQIKMLFLTNPGERIKDSKFGIGIRNYLFENYNDELSDEIKFKINEQFRKYLPYVNINNVEVVSPNNTAEELYINFSYSVSFLNLTEEYIFLV